jgi:hypothetical protein
MAAPVKQTIDFRGENQPPQQILGTAPRMTTLTWAAPTKPYAAILAAATAIMLAVVFLDLLTWIGN